MNRLLSAGFMRLGKSRMFWTGIAVMCVLAVLMVVSVYRVVQSSDGLAQPSLDYVFFFYLQVIGFASAVFCSFFSGTEYSDGTIRNKLVAGHTRAAIYLSNLVVNVAATVFFCLAALLAVVLLGLPLLGGLVTGSKTIAVMLLGSMVTVAAFSAIFTLVSMLSQNRSVGVSVCMIAAVVLFFVSIIIMQRLEEPEVYNEDTYVMDSGEMEPAERIPNPYYIRGVKRKVYMFLNDFLPSGQVIQYYQIHVEHPVRLPLYSLGILVVTTAAGMYVFGRKNIK